MITDEVLEKDNSNVAKETLIRTSVLLLQGLIASYVGHYSIIKHTGASGVTGCRYSRSESLISKD